MTGYSREEAIGLTPRILQGPETDMELIHGLKEGLLRGERFFGETVNYRKDGTPFNIEWSISPVTNPAGQASHYVAVQRDVTDSKRYELEREARQRAEEMVRLRDAFLTNMSHEIRTPLTGIIGFAQILAEEVQAEQREFAGSILKNGERLLDTLNGVLELARLQSLSAFEVAPVEVRTSVRGALDRIRPALIARGLTLEDDLARCKALANAAELSQLLAYLLDNAVKFTERGHVRVRAYQEAGTVTVEVEDTGVGISEAFLPFVFDEFKQESDGLDRAFEGSGLGLTLAQRQAALMNGSIRVESEKGRGSRFILTLPAA